MSKITLPDHNICTGCGVCEISCPKSAVSMRPDEMGVYYPVINYDVCIGCGNCQRVCHLNKEIVLPKSDRAYAAFSNDKEERASSASGGIAAELYKYARNKGWHTYGVEFNHNSNACYKELITGEDFKKAKNSKYVFCDAQNVYKQISEQLLNGETVLFIGIPCQVSALICFIGGRKDNLIIVDLLCHGTCPVSYLDSHIDSIEQKKGKHADEISFRDPQYFTHTYTFTLKQQNIVFYHMTPEQVDAYQIGYHKGLIYKENCYHCKYAREERTGDLTISDFSGLGKLAPYYGSKRSVSCVIVSTEKGKIILEKLNEQGLITIDQRPAEEAFKYDKMFQQPTIPHKSRQKFKNVYVKTQDFESAAKNALKSELKLNWIKMVLHVKEVHKLGSIIKHKLIH